jgi:hypothetical protein
MKNKTTFGSFIFLILLLISQTSCNKDCFGCQNGGGGNAFGGGYASSATPLSPAYVDLADGQTAWVLTGQPDACEASSQDLPMTLVQVQITGINDLGYTWTRTGAERVINISAQSNVLKSQISAYFLIDRYKAVIIDWF